MVKSTVFHHSAVEGDRVGKMDTFKAAGMPDEWPWKQCLPSAYLIGAFDREIVQVVDALREQPNVDFHSKLYQSSSDVFGRQMSLLQDVSVGHLSSDVAIERGIPPSVFEKDDTLLALVENYVQFWNTSCQEGFRMDAPLGLFSHPFAPAQMRHCTFIR